MPRAPRASDMAIRRRTERLATPPRQAPLPAPLGAARMSRPTRCSLCTGRARQGPAAGSARALPPKPHGEGLLASPQVSAREHASPTLARAC
eukprot:15437864-Alexandrium_andersonii.AAC.1